MKKYLASAISFCLLSLFFVPILATAQIVPCNGPDCTICSVFQMLANIYNFLVIQVAAPVATVALVVGAIFILVSGGNPNLHSTGKKILYVAMIGLFLAFASWLIIDTILSAIGYKFNGGNWFTLSGSC